MQCIIYADIKSLIKEINERANNPGNFPITKINEHIPCGYSMSTIWAFDLIENKQTFYRGKECIKKFCEFLREHAKKYNWFWKGNNVIVNKRTIKITSRCKIILHLRKRNLKKVL